MTLLTPQRKNSLYKVLPFALIWGVFGFLYAIVEYGIMGDASNYPSTGNPYVFSVSLVLITGTALLMGILLAVAELTFINRMFERRAFWKKVVFKSAIYLVAILFLIVVIGLSVNSLRFEKPVSHPDVVNSIKVFVFNFAFVSIVMYTGMITIISVFVMEVTDFLGSSVFSNFFTGKYQTPREEDRIFMFLDMRSSTSIAEQLGHERFFRLLNQFYRDTTDPILETGGKVYQYVGDEVIVTWPLEKGIANSNCVRCFILIKDKFEKQANKYTSEFGLVPEFKAGLHCGRVTTGEIGVLKKDIFFTGDVLNTTARIQSRCNDLGEELLLSGSLLSHLNLGTAYTVVPKGETSLRGRHKPIELYGVSAAGNKQY